MKKVFFGTTTGEFAAFDNSTTQGFDTLTIREISEIFKDKFPEAYLDNHKIMQNDREVLDLNVLAEDGATYTFSNKLTSGSDEHEVLTNEPEVVPEATEVKAKKVDKFTKEFVETSSLKELKKELLLWAIGMKVKNKYITAKAAALTGLPADFVVGGQSYKVLVLDSPLRLQTEEIVEIIGMKQIWNANDGESKEELIVRYNNLIGA